MVPVADGHLLRDRRLVVGLPPARQDRRKIGTRRERQVRGERVVHVRQPGLRMDRADADAVAAGERRPVSRRSYSLLLVSAVSAASRTAFGPIRSEPSEASRM